MISQGRPACGVTPRPYPPPGSRLVGWLGTYLHVFDLGGPPGVNTRRAAASLAEPLGSTCCPPHARSLAFSCFAEAASRMHACMVGVHTHPRWHPRFMFRAPISCSSPLLIRQRGGCHPEPILFLTPRFLLFLLFLLFLSSAARWATGPPSAPTAPAKRPWGAFIRHSPKGDSATPTAA